MLNVVLFDKQRDTYTSISNVASLESAIVKVNGRYTKLWLLTDKDGKQQTYKYKDFAIDSVKA